MSSPAQAMLETVRGACQALVAGDRPAGATAAALGPVLEDPGPPLGVRIDLRDRGWRGAQVLRSPVGDEPAIVDLVAADPSALSLADFEAAFGPTAEDPPLGPGEPRSASVLDTSHAGWVLSLVVELGREGISRVSVRRDRPAQDPLPG